MFRTFAGVLRRKLVARGPAEPVATTRFVSQRVGRRRPSAFSLLS